MFELTPDQRAELCGPEPARAVDPDTKAEYVLVPADLYERIRAVFEEDSLDMRQVAKMVEQAMCEDDADDPFLESYQKYRTQS
jgi:hypothetical protein